LAPDARSPMNTFGGVAVMVEVLTKRAVMEAYKRII
jgi:hypothetical protein